MGDGLYTYAPLLHISLAINGFAFLGPAFFEHRAFLSSFGA